MGMMRAGEQESIQDMRTPCWRCAERCTRYHAREGSKFESESHCLNGFFPLPHFSALMCSMAQSMAQLANKSPWPVPFPTAVTSGISSLLYAIIYRPALNY